MARKAPGQPSRWQIWDLGQLKSKQHTNPPQPTDSKPYRPYLILSDVSHYKKVTCLPIQDLGSKAGVVEVELLNKDYPLLKKDSKILCYEIYTLFESDFEVCICSLKDSDRKEVIERVKRYLKI